MLSTKDILLSCYLPKILIFWLPIEDFHTYIPCYLLQIATPDSNMILIYFLLPADDRKLVFFLLSTDASNALIHHYVLKIRNFIYLIYLNSCYLLY